MSIEIKEDGGISQAHHAIEDAKRAERMQRKVSAEDFQLSKLKLMIQNDGEYLSGFEDGSLEVAVKAKLLELLGFYAASKRQEAKEWLEYALKGDSENE